MKNLTSRERSAAAIEPRPPGSGCWGTSVFQQSVCAVEMHGAIGASAPSRWRLSYGLCLAALFAGSLLAADGKVLNITTGKPQAGATVTLYKISKDGPEPVESVKSAADGSFKIDKAVDAAGPSMIQTAFDGVTYNHRLTPADRPSGLELKVYNSSKQQSDAKHARLPSAESPLTRPPSLPRPSSSPSQSWPPATDPVSNSPG